MYSYEEERPRIFTEEGMKMFMQIRDRVKELLKFSGAATVGKIMDGVTGGDSFQMIACIDYLVERYEIKYVNILGEGWKQHQVVAEVRKY